MPALHGPVRIAEGNLDIRQGGQLHSDLDSIWILCTAFLIFFMQIGFAMLEAGSVRYKSTKNILLKNVLNTTLGALMWWAVGHSFASADCDGHPNSFIGLRGFLSSAADLDQGSNYWSLWLFGWVFAAVSVTIPSGALAERCQLRAYLIYTFWQVAWTYPMVVHWVWSQAGWLSPFRLDCATMQPNVRLSRSIGVIDFAGSANVHMVGGAAALVGAIMIGPRLERFTSEGCVIEMPPCNPNFQVLGTLILWVGWYGFNAGSTGCMYGCMHVAAAIAVNTTLAAAAGGLTGITLHASLGYPGDIAPVLNGILAGLVGITSSCAVVQSYAAVIIGIVAAFVWLATSRLLITLQIDDPLDAAPIHFFCGIWGVMAAGFFATKTSVAAAYPSTQNKPADWGVFYGGHGYQLGVQLLAAVVIAAWSLGISWILFGTLKWLGWLRVGQKDEETGLDRAQGIGTGINIFCPCL